MLPKIRQEGLLHKAIYAEYLVMISEAVKELTKMPMAVNEHLRVKV